MITLTKNGNAIVFTFEDNAHYLFDGTIEVPINSLTLITDNSQMATFKKSASNDIFISATYAELGMSKAELESWFKENACGSTGGGGVTSGEVETMIDQAISGKQDTLIAGSGITISGNVISSEGGNKVVELTQAQYDALVDKDPDTFYIITDAQPIDINNYYNKTEVDTALAAKANTATTYTKTEVDTALANKADTSAVTEAISSAVSGKVNTSVYNTYTAATDSRLAEDEEVTAAGLNALNDRIDAIDITVHDAKAYYISFATIATTGIRDEDWDGIVAAIDGHRPIYAGYPRNDGGILYYGVECMNKNGNNTQIILTSSDDNSHYFYTFTKNGSNDYTFTSETRPYTTQAEKDAWNAKQDALSAGTGIEISGNVISATGGGGVTVDPTLDSGSTNPVANSAITTALDTKISNIGKTNQTWVGQGVTSLMKYYKDNNGEASLGLYLSSINGKSIIEDSYINLNQFSLVETSAIVTSVTSSSTDVQVPSAKAVYDAIQAGGGGGTTYSAGTNISIANDTINCTLPISANTNNKNVTVGYDLNVREEGETSIGKYNLNRYASATAHSGNTIFTVGNGGSNGLRHNALEIRKNGDLYFADTSNKGQSYYEKPMVRLQDMYAALGGLKFVKLTQQEYDALATKDANTLYIISNVVS